MQRGASASMPTLASTPAADSTPAHAAAAPSTYRRRRPGDTTAESRASGRFWKPLLAALVGLCVVLGVVLVLDRLLGPDAARQNATPPPVAAAPAPEIPRPSPSPAPPVSNPPSSESAPAAPAVAEQPAPDSQPAPPAQAPAPVKQKPAVVRPPASAAEHLVTVESVPPGAVITFDNNPSISCKTPCTMPLFAGRHSARASLAGYRDEFKFFDTPGEVLLFFRMELRTGQLSIKTVPPGASIFVNGQQRPEKTPAILNLPPGKHRIGLTLAGHAPDEQEIEIREGSLKNYVVDWTAK